MSDERVVQRADLSRIEANLSHIVGQINGVEGRVGQVAQQVHEVQGNVSQVDARLEKLVGEFHEFLRKDLMAKELQLAETRVIKVRQELADKYGHYDEVRRVTTGILQAADVTVVRHDVINNCTEELMLKAPGYWLAPCLIALAAWLNDNRDLAERALSEAMRRNDERTSLFFALLARRAGRFQACECWLERYFAMQDPAALDRDMVVVLDSFASGLLGSDSSGICSKKIQAWVEELSARVGFVEDQQRQWDAALRSKLPPPTPDEFPYLQKYSPTCQRLTDALRGARLHGRIHEHFEGIFTGELPPPVSLAAKVDDLLDQLVTNFDTEELPLRREERLLTLIIQENGDRPAAQQQMSVEKALDENVSFTQLLTNAAMHPETANATRATQRLAVALSRQWITTAYDDLTAGNRAAVPPKVDLSIEQWTGSTTDGSNEDELGRSVSAYVRDKLIQTLSKLRLTTGHYVGFGAVAALGVLFLVQGALLMALAGIGGAVAWYYVTKNNLQRAQEKAREDCHRLEKSMQEVLRASLAEVVDWRRSYAEADAQHEKASYLLTSISPEQYISNSFSRARMVL